MKKLIAILIVFLAGCSTPHNIAPELERVNEVSIAQLTAHAATVEEHYWKYAQREGIIWPPLRSDPSLENPDMYNNGGDSALFTGYMLAASVYKYKTTLRDKDLFSAMRSLRGLYILTHATGTPGVISRCAFPASEPEKWNFPDAWGSRIARGFVNTGPARQSSGTGWYDQMTSYPAMTYYTRATRDQLTGILFGLSVVWAELDDLSNPKIVDMRRVVQEITNDLYNHIRANDFSIVDEKGENQTNADDVSNHMKAQLFSLYRLTAPEERRERIQEKYEDQFCFTFGIGSFEPWNVFNNYSQYYAWNLRYARAYSIWLLETNSERKKKLVDYFENKLWSLTKDQGCPFFTYMYAHVTGNILEKQVGEGLFALQSLVLRPTRQYSSPLCGDERKPNIFQVLFGDDIQYYLPPHLRKPTDYFTWTKRGWDTGHCIDGEPLGDNTNLDFLLPYWMGRFLGLVPAE